MLRMLMRAGETFERLKERKKTDVYCILSTRTAILSKNRGWFLLYPPFLFIPV